MNDQNRTPTGEDLSPAFERLSSMISENTNELKAMQQLFASMKAATDTSVEHTRTLAQNSSWEKQGPHALQVLKEAVQEEREQAGELLAAGEFYRENASKFYALCKEQMDTSAKMTIEVYAIAAKHHEAAMTREKGKWRRGAMIAAFGAVCAAAGFFGAGEFARWELIQEVRDDLMQSSDSQTCRDIGGRGVNVGAEIACLVPQNSNQTQ